MFELRKSLQDIFVEHRVGRPNYNWNPSLVDGSLSNLDVFDVPRVGLAATHITVEFFVEASNVIAPRWPFHREYEVLADRRHSDGDVMMT